jgi:hypothetical protein
VILRRVKKIAYEHLDIEITADSGKSLIHAKQDLPDILSPDG